MMHFIELQTLEEAGWLSGRAISFPALYVFANVLTDYYILRLQRVGDPDSWVWKFV